MYYIGIDVSKKALSVYDGEHDLEFENTKGLKAFKRYLKKRYKSFDKLGVLFEATGIYSDHLKAFCSRYQIKAYFCTHFAGSGQFKQMSQQSESCNIGSSMNSEIREKSGRNIV